MDKEKAKQEALRYVENAREILSEKACKKEGWYTDSKYVRMAGNTLWNGVLLALDYPFPEVQKGKGSTSQSIYHEQIRDGNSARLVETENYLPLYSCKINKPAISISVSPAHFNRVTSF